MLAGGWADVGWKRAVVACRRALLLEKGKSWANGWAVVNWRLGSCGLEVDCPRLEVRPLWARRGQSWDGAERRRQAVLVWRLGSYGLQEGSRGLEVGQLWTGREQSWAQGGEEWAGG